MRLLFYQDIFLNVALPILVGSFIYLHFQPLGFLKIVYNYLPDGLWAYALLSTMLIIWKRRIHIFWVIISFLLFIVFEVLQHVHIIRGKGDLLDIFIYCLFGLTALITNKYYNPNKQN